VNEKHMSSFAFEALLTHGFKLLVGLWYICSILYPNLEDVVVHTSKTIIGGFESI